MAGSTSIIKSNDPSNLHTMAKPTCNWKTLGFAILIIAGVGGLAVAGVGLGTLGVHQMWWVAGTLSQLSQINAIVMMTVGGAGGMTLLVIGIVNAVKNHHQNKSIIADIAAFIANTSKGNIRDDVRFGRDEWAKYFGDIGEEPALPDDIDAILNEPCPFSKNPNIKVKHTHMLVLIPATVKGEALTLDKFQELVKAPQNGGRASDYHYYSTTVKDEFGTKPVEKSHWVLMTRDVIPGSRNKTYDEQKNMVAHYDNYELLDTLKTVIGMFAEYVDSGTHLYGTANYTRTKDQTQRGPVAVVGSFTPTGLSIHDFNKLGNDAIVGVGAVRKLKVIGT